MPSVMSAAVPATHGRAPGGGLAHPVREGGALRAVLFDLDGTLYRQQPVRLAMAAELMSLPLRSPRHARRHLAALARFRDAQEQLREHEAPVTPDAQIAIAASASAVPAADVRRLVDEWMHQRPLKYLRACRARGVERVLDLLDRRGVRAGVLTDYPAEAKLRALGLRDRFSLVLCSTDPEIGHFKPHPRGFLRACERWGLAPDEVLMIGDRVEVDAAGAHAAGMSSVIIGRPRNQTPIPASCMLVPSFERLHDVLDRCS